MPPKVSLVPLRPPAVLLSVDMQGSTKLRSAPDADLLFFDFREGKNEV
jgi:hypothetical protein